MKKIWMKEKIVEDAKKYTNPTDWQNKSKGACCAAHRLKIYNEVTAHMTRKPIFWTDEEIIVEAKLYFTKAEWIKNSRTSQYAYKRNLLDIACRHMKPTGNRYMRQIYAIENGDKSVYVGLSYNPQIRYKQHINPNSRQPCSSILYKYYLDGNQKIKVFETLYSLEEIQQKEAEYIEKYRNEGWKILNIAKAGALGTPKIKYTREYCAEISKNCASRKEFQLKHWGVYQALRRCGWFDLITHLKHAKAIRYSEKEIHDAALKCKTRNEFFKKFNHYYQSAAKRGILEKVTQHLPSRRKLK